MLEKTGVLFRYGHMQGDLIQPTAIHAPAALHAASYAYNPFFRPTLREENPLFLPTRLQELATQAS